MGFNGGYQCNGDENSYSCVIHCPLGINFDFPPSVKYTCLYEKGIFEPHPIPQCLLENGMDLQKIEKTIQNNSSSIIKKEAYQNIFATHDFDNIIDEQKV